MGARSSQSRGPGLNKTDGHLLEYFRQNFGAGGGGTNYVAPASGLTATGGVISDYTSGSDVYRAHIFTSSGTFEVSEIGDFGDTVEYLVVAGAGGGGGGYYGGGGGAGGVRTNLSGHPLATGNPSFSVPTTGGNGSGSYTVTIGGGGAGGYYPGPSATNNGNDGVPGIDSYFGPPSTPAGITAKGGGKGMGRATSVAGATDGYPGGSGGGIAYRGPAVGYGYNPSTPSPITPNIPSPHPYGITQGYPGGLAPNTSTYGSGGGGAGGPGAVGGGPSAHGADGGSGTQVLIAGPPTTSGVGAPGPGGGLQWFAGGGAGGGGGTTHPTRYGGGADPSGNNTGTGPFAGGGNGGDDLDSPTLIATSGLSGTGGGGGGGASVANRGDGGAGGSGIVVVRYQIGTVQTGDAKATGGAISYYGDKTIHTFTNSGTFASLPTWSPSTPVEYVVVAGGGAAGQTTGGWGGGGGGAGGYRTGTTPFSGPFSFAVSVGAGGAHQIVASPNPGSNNRQGSSGVNSSAAFPTGTITSAGGGGGGKTESPSTPTHSAGTAGGSGGGGSGQGGPGAGNTPLTSPAQGNAGGSGSDGITSYTAGGGGGGAGGSGTNAGSGSGGAGGVGVQVPSTFQNPAVAPSDTTNPVPYQRGGGLGTPGPGGSYYLAGGGGGAHNNQPGGSGGSGGGGKGGGPPDGSSIAAVDGVQSTGGGGGGIGSPAQTRAGGGGSGIVLIAYPS